MSGDKTIQIDLERWYRRWVAEPARAVSEQVREAIRSRAAGLLDADLAAVHDRQAAVEQAVERLDERSREVERATSQRLDDHIDQVERRIHASTSGLRTELGELVSDLERTIRRDLDEQRRQVRAELDDVTEKVDVMVDARQRAADLAAAALADADVMRDLIATTLPHDRFAPERLAQLDTDLAGARMHLDEGLVEAAVVRAQDAFDALSTLRVDVELRHREWITLRGAALESLLLVSEQIRLNETALAGEATSAALDAARFDVDHWSDGTLAELRQEVAASVTEVEEGDLTAGSLTVEALRDIVSSRVPEYDARLGEIVENARRRVVAAQVRANIADLVADALEGGFAYRTEQWLHAGDDQREALYVRLGHLSGNEIVVEVAPSGADRTGNELRVRSIDRDAESAGLRHARMDAITDHLRTIDLPMGPVIDRGEPDLTALPEAIRPAVPLAPGNVRTPATPSRDGVG